MSKNTGTWGEERAARYLEEQGFTILARNYRAKGREEIDIVCRKGDDLHFVEVKTRRSFRYGPARSAVDGRKVLRITRAAYAFLKERRLKTGRTHFSVIEVKRGGDGWEIDFITDAFHSAF